MTLSPAPYRQITIGALIGLLGQRRRRRDLTVWSIWLVGVAANPSAIVQNQSS